MALPLVKRGRLYGSWYHHKTSIEKMPGNKAMTATGRQVLKMIWGWSLRVVVRQTARGRLRGKVSMRRLM